ncbi:MAG: twin-arginine translocation signal domain-containing protein [Anaerolineaceae bacterium]|nr:MAG: twin-arginine translocation signal domain-containing protein [Anaerolineaceae bacterium]
MSNFSRRDFLKLAGLTVSSAALAHPLVRAAGKAEDLSRPNIIVLIFDTMTASHLSLYGYPRLTSPNFSRFAERSTVFHRYNSAGNYTVPGTASLLTGMYPWTHRALNHSGLVRRDMLDRNIFALLGDDYSRTGFSQNGWASFLLTQFRKDLDTYLSPAEFSLVSQVFGDGLPDTNLALRALDDFMFKMERSPSSLVLGAIERTILYSQARRVSTKDYPRGIPRTGTYPVYFLLNEVLADLVTMFREQKSPTFSYIHLFPPHAPYSPLRQFYGMFWNDKYFPPSKPLHPLGDGHDERKVYVGRLSYDEYVATVDYEFGRFIDAMDEAGVLDNSYLIVTSDHGELMERGCKGHDTPLLYNPIIHCPLIIHAPGQATRLDIHAPVNTVDLLPTILNLAGKPVPDWCDGEILPGFGGKEDPERSTFSVEAKLNPAFAPLQTATIAMRKGDYKMTYYRGYFGGGEEFELYNHAEDLEELTNLYSSEKAIAKQMKDELLERLAEGDKEFSKR